MRRQLTLLLLLIPWAPLTAESPVVVGIAYHDVRDEVARRGDRDEYAVSAEHLAAHFMWLRNNGYTVIGADELFNVGKGHQTLPEKSIVISFDDGLHSVYTHVFPLLKLFGYKAIVSPVTQRMKTPATADYGDRTLSQEDLLTWPQLREMQDSGLVEVASHSHDLHLGIHGNPQGNLQPAAVTRRYNDGNYESDLAYQARIGNDLANTAADIRKHLGRPPRVITWPYGAHNQVARRLARQQGMSLSLSLEPAETRLDNELIVGRHLPIANPGIADFAAMLSPSKRPPPVRAAQVSLDDVFDPDPERQEINLGLLLDRIKALEISHVFLQAFADTDGDGAADALYFPNRHLPMRADLFNRAAWQLATRSGVKVYAWLPLLGFSGPGIDSEWRTLETFLEVTAPNPMAEPRLSPFHSEARRVIAEIYEDLASHAHVQGIHFHDDARLTEFEDANPAALEFYRIVLGPDFTISKAQKDADLLRRWSALKAEKLIAFSIELTEIVRRYQPGIRISRNLLTSAAPDPAGPNYLTQDLDGFLEHYDYVTVTVMPISEAATQPAKFYDRLVTVVRKRPSALDRTIFQLQTVDWRNGNHVPSAALRDAMRGLQARGVRNLAYYPDDFIANHPKLTELRQGISLAEFPRKN
jgi:biofilm PGA synthesis lipoprotein PgaB